MIKMIPDRPLSAHLARAIDTVEEAQDQLYRVRIYDVARLIRDAFPQARSIVIDARQRDVEPEGVQLDSIRGDLAVVLWSADNPRLSNSLASYRTADDYGWSDVVHHIEHSLTSALGPEQPQARWEPYYNDRADNGLFVAQLPIAAEVAAVETIAPGHLTAVLHDTQALGPQLSLARPVCSPTMLVGGVHITASLNDDGRFTVEVDTCAMHAEHREKGRAAVDVRLDGTSLHAPTNADS